MNRFRLFLLLLAALVLASSGPPTKLEGSAYAVEPCLKSSKLCPALIEHFTFDEPSDYARYGAYGTTLHEPVGQNVASTTGKRGNAASFSGTSSSFLWSSTFVPPMSTNWTVTFWFRATALPSSGNRAAFVSRDAANFRGSSIWLYNNGTNTRVCLNTQNRESTTVTENCNSTAIIASTTYFVAAGVGDSDDTPGALSSWVSINGGAKASTTLSYIPAAGAINHIRIAQRPAAGAGGVGDYFYNGWVDELDFYGTRLGDTAVATLYASGNGLQYPYSTDQTTAGTYYQYPVSVQADNWPYTENGTYEEVDDPAGSHDGVTTVMTFESASGSTFRTGSYYFNLTSPPGGSTINWIKVHVIVARRTAGQCTATWNDAEATDVEPKLRIGGVEYGSAISKALNSYNQNTSTWDTDANGFGCDGDGSGTFNDVSAQWNTNPATGSPWEISDLSALGAGWYMSVQPVVANQGWLQVTSLYLEINASS